MCPDNLIAPTFEQLPMPLFDDVSGAGNYLLKIKHKDLENW